jgi:hypothetical protein
MLKLLPLILCLNQLFPQTERIFVSPEIEVWSAWPNPTSGEATLAYHFKVASPKYRYDILISNILGSELSRHRLYSFETEIKINLEGHKPGIYFYTLAEDFRHVATRKLLIK